MKKRIVAGVLALLLAASALPVNEFADFVPDISITASADEQQDATVNAIIEFIGAKN